MIVPSINFLLASFSRQRHWVAPLITVLLVACGGEEAPTLSKERTITMLSIVATVRYTTMPIGLEQSLEATAIFDFDDATLGVTDQVTWSSSDETIARITDSATVVAESVGPVTLTATLHDWVSSIDLTVVEGEINSDE